MSQEDLWVHSWHSPQSKSKMQHQCIAIWIIDWDLGMRQSVPTRSTPVAHRISPLNSPWVRGSFPWFVCYSYPAYMIFTSIYINYSTSHVSSFPGFSAISCSSFPWQVRHEHRMKRKAGPTGVAGLWTWRWRRYMTMWRLGSMPCHQRELRQQPSFRSLLVCVIKKENTSGIVPNDQYFWRGSKSTSWGDHRDVLMEVLHMDGHLLQQMNETRPTLDPACAVLLKVAVVAKWPNMPDVNREKRGLNGTLL